MNQGGSLQEALNLKFAFIEQEHAFFKEAFKSNDNNNLINNVINIQLNNKLNSYCVKNLTFIDKINIINNSQHHNKIDCFIFSFIPIYMS